MNSDDLVATPDAVQQRDRPECERATSGELHGAGGCRRTRTRLTPNDRRDGFGDSVLGT